MPKSYEYTVKPTDLLSEAGDALIQFSSRYYSGLSLNFTGAAMVIIGASINPAIGVIGLVGMLTGTIIMHTSYKKAGDAGKLLKAAGNSGKY